MWLVESVTVLMEDTSEAEEELLQSNDSDEEGGGDGKHTLKEEIGEEEHLSRGPKTFCNRLLGTTDSCFTFYKYCL